MQIKESRYTYTDGFSEGEKPEIEKASKEVFEFLRTGSHKVTPFHKHMVIVAIGSPTLVRAFTRQAGARFLEQIVTDDSLRKELSKELPTGELNVIFFTPSSVKRCRLTLEAVPS